MEYEVSMCGYTSQSPNRRAASFPLITRASLGDWVLCRLLRYYMTLSMPDGTDENLECLPLLKQSNLEESVVGAELHSLVVRLFTLPKP